MGPGGWGGASVTAQCPALAVWPCVSVGLASDLHPGRIQKSFPSTEAGHSREDGSSYGRPRGPQVWRQSLGGALLSCL